MSSDEFVVEEGTAFYGRTFEEYCELFDLDGRDLVGRRILDCPGGPGSFTAAAARIGSDAVAADPVYGPPVEKLDRRCSGAIDEIVEQVRGKTDFFDWSFYGDVDTRERYARAAATRFLADYARSPDRYVDAALPSLPFEDGAFDLVCSANLLFLYDDRFDRDFHRDAALELARVTAAECRIAGLQSLDAERSVFVEPVVEALRGAGCSVECRDVEYRFQPGPTEVLVVTDVEDVRS
ncbi:SAM-dependent methyltransferase [Salinarchaeum chitinilyticum]